MGNTLDLTSVLGLKVEGVKGVKELKIAIDEYNLGMDNAIKTVTKLNGESQITRVEIARQIEAYKQEITVLRLKNGEFVKASETVIRQVDKEAKALERAANVRRKFFDSIIRDNIRATQAQNTAAQNAAAVAARQAAAQQFGLPQLQALVPGLANGTATQGQQNAARQILNLSSQQGGLAALQQALNAGNTQVLVGNAGKIQQALVRLTAVGGPAPASKWQVFAATFASQAAYRGLTLFVSGLKSGVDEAAKFEKNIAAILTISQGTDLNKSNLRENLVNISNQFGKPIQDVTLAGYEAISNQIVKGSEAFEFLSESAQFAQTTMSSLQDSVNLGASVINSYGKSAGNAREIFAQLFKTIDLGRVKAVDLADTYGRVLPFAAQLGVKLEEVNAALATLTVKGVKPSEALTGITNIFQSLARPTPELTKVLEEKFGVATGDALLRKTGLGGFLQLLTIEGEQGTKHLGDLTTNLRSFRGQLGLIGPSLNTFNESVRVIGGSLDTYNKAVEISTNNSGQRFDVLKTKVSNAFLGIGRDVLNSVVALDDIINNSTFFKNLGENTRTVLGGGAILDAVRSRTRAQNAADIQGQQDFAQFGGLGRELDIIKAQEAAFDRALTDIQKRQTETLSNARKTATDIIKVEDDFQKASKLQFESFGDLFFRQTQETLHSIQDAASKARSEAEKAKKELRQSPFELQKRVDALRDSLPVDNANTFQFQNSRIRSRINKELTDARSVTTVDNLNLSFDTIVKNIEALNKLKQSQFSGGRQTPIQNQLTLERQLTAVNKEREAILRRIIDVQSKEASTQREKVVQEQNRLKTLKDAFADLTQFGLLNESGKSKFKTAEEGQKKFDTISNNIVAILNKTPAKSEEDIANQFKLILAVEERRLSIGRQITAQLEQERIDSTERISAREIEAARKSREEIVNAQRETLKTLYGDIGQLTGITNSVLANNFAGGAAHRTAQQVVKNIESFSKAPNEGNLREIQGLVNKSENPEFAGPGRALIEDALKNFNKLDSLNQIATSTDQAMQRVVADITQVGSRTNLVNAQLQQLGGSVTGYFSQSATTIDTVIVKLQELQTQAEKSALLLNSLPKSGAFNPADLFESDSFRRGGVVYRARGGSIFQSRGTDTQPAMLTPGEIVMPVGPSRKYYSQLLAMVEGRTPAYYAKGGPVTNIGDINVTVQGGNTGEQSLRHIAHGLRREFRRGTIRLN